MPLVSVLFPVYNGENFLEEAIRSILTQTLTDFELIILNDGSTDNSVKIIESFSDPRIRLHHNPGNLKLIATLNRGLELAQGKYIARMDSDDICEPQRFEKQVAFLENNPDYVVVGSNCSLFGDIEGRSDFQLKDEEIRIAICFESPFMHPATMIRTNIIKENKIRYSAELLHIEDWGFWIDLLRYGKCANLKESLFRYRISGQNISLINRHSSEPRYKLFYSKILAEIFESVSEKEIDLHYQLSTGNYKPGSSIEINGYIKMLQKNMILKGYKANLARDFIKKKSSRLVYQICDDSIRHGITFAIKQKILTPQLIRYVLGLLKTKF